MSARPDLAETVERCRRAVATATLRPLHGRVERVVGTMIEARMGGVRVGELCRLHDPSGTAVEAEVVGVADRLVYLTPLGAVAGLSAQATVIPLGRPLSVRVGHGLIGRLLDGLGRPLDDPGLPIVAEAELPLETDPPPPLERPLIERPLALGTRAIDGLLTCAEGQRVGIFGPAGAGKSTLISRIVRGAAADVFVVALVGERGREVREFLDRNLGREGMKRAVVVAATSDRPALERVRAAQVATTVAEWFRDRGHRVVLLVDSLTRLARAWREIGLAAGEPPTRRGYPPSVFAALPRLLERAGATTTGSITAFYTVLVEGELAQDPIAEEVKSILDGHIVLSAKLAEADHHPAIDILQSRSRVMEAVVAEQHSAQAARVRQLMARYDEIELLVRVGEYQAGSDPVADDAIARIDAIRDFLKQRGTDHSGWTEVQQRLAKLAL